MYLGSVHELGKLGNPAPAFMMHNSRGGGVAEKRGGVLVNM